MKTIIREARAKSIELSVERSTESTYRITLTVDGFSEYDFYIPKSPLPTIEFPTVSDDVEFVIPYKYLSEALEVFTTASKEMYLDAFGVEVDERNRVIFYIYNSKLPEKPEEYRESPFFYDIYEDSNVKILKKRMSKVFTVTSQIPSYGYITENITITMENRGTIIIKSMLPKGAYLALYVPPIENPISFEDVQSLRKKPPEIPEVKPEVKPPEKPPEIPEVKPEVKPPEVEVKPPEKPPEKPPTKPPLTEDVVLKTIMELSIRKEMPVVITEILESLKDYDVTNLTIIIDKLVKEGRLSRIWDSALREYKYTTPEAVEELRKRRPPSRVETLENKIIEMYFREALVREGIDPSKYKPLFDETMTKMRGRSYDERLKTAEELARSIIRTVKAAVRPPPKELPRTRDEIYDFIIAALIKRVERRRYDIVAGDVPGIVHSIIDKHIEEYTRRPSKELLDTMIDEAVKAVEEKLREIEAVRPPPAPPTAAPAVEVPITREKIEEVTRRIMLDRRAIDEIFMNGFNNFMLYKGGEYGLMSEFAGDVSAALKEWVKRVGERMRAESVSEIGAKIILTEFNDGLIDRGYGDTYNRAFDEIDRRSGWREYSDLFSRIKVKIDKREYSVNELMPDLIEYQIYVALGFDPPEHLKEKYRAAQEAWERQSGSGG
ncbi:MAG: hypothetical protein ACP5IZ_11285 [Thermoprotei archaeon]